ncbi:AMP-binding protein [Bacillus gobiensis]|uniref:acyl-CoA synthetase MbcS n=1 Tax=Bacillus gobiensis TaxID=1441095 RepID=UPI003D196607
MLNLSDLLPDNEYNLIDEIEKYSSERTAIKWLNEQGDRQEISYAQLLKQVNKQANVLTELELKKGDRVLVIMPRLIDAYVTYLACFKTGIVVIPSSEMLRAKDIEYRLNHGEIKAVISYHLFTGEVDKVKDTSATLKRKISVGGDVSGWLQMEELMENAADSFDTVPTLKDDTLLMSYTSGTTGQPKAVVHSHGWAYAHLRVAGKEWLDISETDTVWATAAPGWQKWVWSPLLSILGCGATGFVYNGKFNPEKYLELLQDEEINVLCCTPTEYRYMAKIDELEKYNLPMLHSAVSAGEPLNAEVITIFKNKLGVQVRDGYGQTENTLLIGTLKGVEPRLGSMGKPMLEGFIDIVDENGVPCEVGETGDIAVLKNLPSLFKGYFKEPELTERTIRGDYYITGDRATKDEDNYYWFQGRGDDVIISSGYTIGPFEVEDALIKHPMVKECAVVASPDEFRGTVVKAFIVLTQPAENEEKLMKELQTHAKTLTAPYKYPRRIEFVQDLPKTNSGKIRRVELREQELRKYLK